MAVSYRVIFVIVIIGIIIVIANSITKPAGGYQEGFNCATETSIANTPFDSTTLVSNLFRLFTTVPKYTKDDIYDILKVLTKIYTAIQTTHLSSDQPDNPFYGNDLVNRPSSCKCKDVISSNFQTRYLDLSKHVISDAVYNQKGPASKNYGSVLRYFLDIEDPSTKTIYTGMGNYHGAYTQNYYSNFNQYISNGIYTPPSEIQTETTWLINPTFNYYLNYYSKYLIIHLLENPMTSSISDAKSVLLNRIIEIAQRLTRQLAAPYDTTRNPFPGQKIYTNIINSIINKARYKTFEDWTEGTCRGSTLNAKAQKTLSNITDKKYFVAYLKSVIQAIQTPIGTTSTPYNDWDSIINDVYDNNTMLLTDPYLLSNTADNVYNLMEIFGHFDPRTNKYTLNDKGVLMVGQLSNDSKKCVLDYLNRISVLVFVPVKYGGEVNYDPWGFFN